MNQWKCPKRGDEYPVMKGSSINATGNRNYRGGFLPAYWNVYNPFYTSFLGRFGWLVRTN